MNPLRSLLASLLAIPSINPTLANGAGEGELAAWLMAWFAARAVPCTLQPVAEGRSNVLAHLPGRGAAAPLLLNAHMDTVGVEGMADPFTLRAEGDRWYGRGSYDMKGSIAIMLALAEVLRDEPPAGDVWLTFVCDEEDRSLGSERLLREWLPTLAAPPVAALVLEPTEEAIGIAHKGFAWFEVECVGRAGHGSRPDEAADAILPLGAALGQLAALEASFVAGARHPLLGRPSLHASTVEGGSARSVYPAEARLRWERRTLPDEQETLLEAELEQVLAAARVVNDATVTGRHVFGRGPLGTPQSAPLVRVLQRARGDAPLVGLSFWTDGALFSAAGLDTVIFGPIGHGAHAVDEWVSAASLERVLAVTTSLLQAGGW